LFTKNPSTKSETGSSAETGNRGGHSTHNSRRQERDKDDPKGPKTPWNKSENRPQLHSDQREDDAPGRLGHETTKRGMVRGSGGVLNVEQRDTGVKDTQKKIKATANPNNYEKNQIQRGCEKVKKRSPESGEGSRARAGLVKKTGKPGRVKRTSKESCIKRT